MNSLRRPLQWLGMMLIWLAPVAALAGPLNVQSSQHYLDPENPRQTQFGKLTYVAGIVLKSGNPEFGGYSGLLVSADGARLLAVSDRGHWLAASLAYKDGRIGGVTNATLSPLLDETGQPVNAGGKADSESLAAGQPGNLAGPVLVSFERDHRVLRYPLNQGGFRARPERVFMPPKLSGAPSNKGIEALEQRADGAILALTEEWLDGDGNHTGWLVGKDAADDIRLRRDGLFDPTDMKFLPDGDLLVLERRFTVLGGPGMQIRRIRADSIRPGALLDGEVLISLTAKYGIDNMEGLAVRSNAAGGTELFVISDDNFSGVQKTLLLQFLLPHD